MITGRQIRAARGLLNWSAETLAGEAGLSRVALQRIESGDVEPRASNLTAILDVLDREGIEFNGERGVAFKDNQVVTLKGENIFFRLLDDVIVTLKGQPKPEALFACVDDKKSPPAVIENYRNLRGAKIAMRSLVKDGNTFLMGRLSEYRYLPARHYHNNATVIYGDKFATMILDENSKDIAAVIIHNAHIAAAQRNLFNLIWSTASKPSESTAGVRYER